MRTRIALAAALAATFTITFLDIYPAAAQRRPGTTQRRRPVLADQLLATTDTVGSTHAGNTHGVLAAFTESGPGHQAVGLTTSLLLWPKVANASPATTHWARSSADQRPGPSPTPPPAPSPPPPPPPAPTNATSTATTDWQCIRVHESGDVYNDPARPSGAYGILESTWESYGYSGWPYQAAAAVQDALALELYHEYGWRPWSTSATCGL